MSPTQPIRFFGINDALFRLRLLLTAALVLFGFVSANSQEQTSERVRILVYNDSCRGHSADEATNKELFAAQNYYGWQVKFGDRTIAVDHTGLAMVELS